MIICFNIKKISIFRIFDFNPLLIYKHSTLTRLKMHLIKRWWASTCLRKFGRAASKDRKELIQKKEIKCHKVNRVMSVVGRVKKCWKFSNQGNVRDGRMLDNAFGFPQWCMACIVSLASHWRQPWGKTRGNLAIDCARVTANATLLYVFLCITLCQKLVVYRYIRREKSVGRNVTRPECIHYFNPHADYRWWNVTDKKKQLCDIIHFCIYWTFFDSLINVMNNSRERFIESG